MGGRALQHVGVERKNKQDYDIIVDKTLRIFTKLFPLTRITPVVAYGGKDSFGDADLLVESDTLPPTWPEILRSAFKPQAFISNGGVHSFDVDNLQIDLITVPSKSFDFAKNYFDFNDLGNLMGRVAHKMGFKYGHLGLFAPLRDGDHQYAEIEITRDSATAMRFLGYDPVRHAKGFSSLEEVFEFAITSPYVHRAIFLLDNRNAKSRMRDSKRPTYTKFLDWLPAHPEADRYVWPQDLEDKQRLKSKYLDLALASFPSFKASYDEANTELVARRAFRERWNGTLVSSWTGLEGKELGRLMAACTARPDFQPWVLDLDSAVCTEELRKTANEIYASFPASAKPSKIKP